MQEVQQAPFIIKFPSIGSSTLGFISIAEVSRNISFDIKRVYWTYFTPNNVKRGGHAHKSLQQMIFAVSGTIEIKTENRNGENQTFLLDSPDKGLFIPALVWRDIKFSHNAVLLCLASEVYREEDYIRNYAVFKSANGI